MTEKIDPQSRKEPGASSVFDSRGPMLSARVAEECNRVLKRELTDGGERAHSDLVKRATVREADEWKQLEVY